MPENTFKNLPHLREISQRLGHTGTLLKELCFFDSHNEVNFQFSFFCFLFFVWQKKGTTNYLIPTNDSFCIYSVSIQNRFRPDRTLLSFFSSHTTPVWPDWAIICHLCQNINVFGYFLDCHEYLANFVKTLLIFLLNFLFF